MWLSYYTRKTNDNKDHRQDLRESITGNEINILAVGKVEFPIQPEVVNFNIIHEIYYYLI